MNFSKKLDGLDGSDLKGQNVSAHFSFSQDLFSFLATREKNMKKDLVTLIDCRKKVNDSMPSIRKKCQNMRISDLCKYSLHQHHTFDFG